MPDTDLTPKYKRVLLKLSGEALGHGGKSGISLDECAAIGEQLKRVAAGGVQLAVVVGGGNILRGAQFSAGGNKRVLINLDEMSPYLLNAVVAAEDRSFFQHGGVDPWGIARAVYRDLAGSASRQGGSTITQQLVKQVYLNADRTPVDRDPILEARPEVGRFSRCSTRCWRRTACTWATCRPSSPGRRTPASE